MMLMFLIFPMNAKASDSDAIKLRDISIAVSFAKRSFDETDLLKYEDHIIKSLEMLETVDEIEPYTYLRHVLTKEQYFYLEEFLYVPFDVWEYL